MAAFWPKLESLLDAGERLRAAGLARNGPRHRFIAAHALKRLMLSRLGDASVAPTDWAFAAAKRGKPQVSGHGPHFSIAHCDGMVACAVDALAPIGVDVEPSERTLSAGLAAHVFAPPELAWIAGRPESAAMILWTLKEAVVKATGEGLGRGLRDIIIDPDALTLGGASAAWRLLSRPMVPRHRLALAWQDRLGSPAPVVAQVRLEDLAAELV